MNRIAGITMLLSLTFSAFAAVPDAPTGLEASDGSYTTRIALSWEHVRDATLYRVFRNTTNDPATATDIGTTASITFNSTVAINQTFFYWVRAENASGVSALSTADQGSSSVAFTPPAVITPVAPAGSPLTGARVYLGKTLFWDEQLSSTKTVACGTCHIPRAGGSDPRATKDARRALHPGFDGIFGTADDVTGSIGVPLTKADGSYLWSTFGLNPQVTNRHANSSIDAAFAQVGLFWDGRATPQFSDPSTGAVLLANNAALESQAVAPLLNSVEMGHDGRTIADVVTRLSESRPLALSPAVPTALLRWIGGRSYAELFHEAFGSSEITGARIAMAIASYERTLVADRVGTTTTAPPPGAAVFARSGCGGCHAPPIGSDDQFHVTGVRPAQEDLGRAIITGAPRDQGAFRTPGLRNVGLRPSLQHTGRMTLEEVVEFYNRGGDFATSPGFPRGLLNPLNLSAQDKADLVAFLRYQQTDQRAAREAAPLFDRPMLYSESARVPVLTGSGVGSNEGIPEIVALEPPYAGNPRFTIAVGNIAPGSQAVLVIDRVDPAVTTVPATASFLRQPVTVSSDHAGHGFASVSVAIPADASGMLYARWFVTTNGQLSVSRAAQFTIFNPTPTTETFTSYSAASLVKGPVAPLSIVSGFGLNLTTSTVSAPEGSLPLTLGGLRLSITDRVGHVAEAPLFFVSASQINYLLPATVATGEASVRVLRGDTVIASGTLQISAVAPSLFTANSSGRDAAAALITITSNGQQATSGIVRIDTTFQQYVPQPIPAGSQSVLLLFGTGIRGAAQSTVTATIGDTPVEVLYAGPQQQYEGLDQVNLRLPASLAGRGELDVALWADGQRANTVRISVQ
jgi:uncharacterized protein (TIGR03437 family)